MPPPLLRPSELARFWELHPKTVYQWIRDGRLPAMRTPGAQYRLRAADVAAFCAREGRPVPASATTPKLRVCVVASIPAERVGHAPRDVEVWVVNGLAPALLQIAAAPPALLIIDAAVRDVDLEAAVVALRHHTATAKLAVIVLDASPSKRRALQPLGVTGCVARAARHEAMVAALLEPLPSPLASRLTETGAADAIARGLLRGRTRSRKA